MYCRNCTEELFKDKAEKQLKLLRKQHHFWCEQNPIVYSVCNSSVSVVVFTLSEILPEILSSFCRLRRRPKEKRFSPGTHNVGFIFRAMGYIPIIFHVIFVVSHYPFNRLRVSHFFQNLTNFSRFYPNLYSFSTIYPNFCSFYASSYFIDPQVLLYFIIQNSCSTLVMGLSVRGSDLRKQLQPKIGSLATTFLLVPPLNLQRLVGSYRDQKWFQNLLSAHQFPTTCRIFLMYLVA